MHLMSVRGFSELGVGVLTKRTFRCAFSNNRDDPLCSPKAPRGAVKSSVFCPSPHSLHSVCTAPSRHPRNLGPLPSDGGQPRGLCPAAGSSPGPASCRRDTWLTPAEQSHGPRSTVLVGCTRGTPASGNECQKMSGGESAHPPPLGDEATTPRVTVSTTPSVTVSSALEDTAQQK